MIVVSFYTAGPYEAEVQRLRKSLDRVGMRYHFKRRTLPVPAPHLVVDEWDLATSLKPRFLRIMRETVSAGMLYIDADAVVHENCSAYFECLAGKYDIAAHWLEQKRLLTGTLWIGDSKCARQLLEAWDERNLAKQERDDWTGGGQRNLWEVINEGKVPNLRMHRLPGRYCYAFRRPDAYPPDEPRIIEHLLASRENRGASRGKKDSERQERIKQLEEGG